MENTNKETETVNPNRGSELGAELGLVTPEIKSGMVVDYNGGYYRVRAAFKHTVNLGPVFGNGMSHKKVPIDQVREAYDEFYSYWSKSESYMCM